MLVVFNIGRGNIYRLSVRGIVPQNFVKIEREILRTVAPYQKTPKFVEAICMAETCYETLTRDFFNGFAVEFSPDYFFDHAHICSVAELLQEAKRPIYCTTLTNSLFFKALLALRLKNHPVRPFLPCNQQKKITNASYGLGRIIMESPFFKGSFFSVCNESDKYFSRLLISYGFRNIYEQRALNVGPMRESNPSESREYKVDILMTALYGLPINFVVTDVQPPNMIKLEHHPKEAYISSMRKQITSSELRYTVRLSGYFPGQVRYLDARGYITAPPWMNPEHKYHQGWRAYMDASATKKSLSFFKPVPQPNWQKELLSGFGLNS